MAVMADMRKQVVTGVYSPEQGEAMIRQVFPSVAAFPAVATLGRLLIRSYLLAPFGWALMLPVYFLKVLPVVGRRYTLTNQRVMVEHGLTRVPGASVPLAAIDEIRIVEDDNSTFFRSGNMEIISAGNVALTLLGVPEPQAFRHAILNSVKAWVPGKASMDEFVSAASMKK